MMNELFSTLIMESSKLRYLNFDGRILFGNIRIQYPVAKISPKIDQRWEGEGVMIL